MKTIRLIFNKDLSEVDMTAIDNIVEKLKKQFNVIEDDDSMLSLRFVEIDAEHLTLETYPFIRIQDITIPHLHIGIYDKYLYKVEIVL